MRSVLIVAGGKGLRMGKETPKQFLLLSGVPVLMYTVRSFYEADPDAQIIVVLPEDHFDNWYELQRTHNFRIPHKTVAGGETRFHSVKNGLAEVPAHGFVAIHDGARPLIDPVDIKRLFIVAEIEGNAVPVIPLTESLRQVKDTQSEIVNRTKYRLVQTPQIFPAEKLKKAYETGYDPGFTDDASVYEAAGFSVHITEGNPRNIKITRPDDLLIAQALLRRPFQE